MITSEFQLNALSAQVCKHFNQIFDACYVKKMQKIWTNTSTKRLCEKERENRITLYTILIFLCSEKYGKWTWR